MKKKEQLVLTLNRIDEYLGRVDGKSNFWMTFNTFLIGTIFLSKDKMIPNTCIVCPLSIMQILWWIALVSAFTSLICTFVATKAFLDSGNKGNNSEKYITLFFFGSIASLSQKDYKNRIKESSSHDLENDLINQIHILSIGLDKKFKWINYSQKLSAISLCSIFLLIFFNM